MLRRGNILERSTRTLTVGGAFLLLELLTLLGLKKAAARMAYGISRRSDMRDSVMPVLGAALIRGGQIDAGLMCFQRASKAHPTKADFHVEVGMLFEELGLRQRALDSYNAALLKKGTDMPASFRAALEQRVASLKQADRKG